MQWNIISRTIKFNDDKREIIKNILKSSDIKCEPINKLIIKFNEEIIVLNNDELSTLHVVLVDSISRLNDSDRDFINGFICNVN